MKFKLFKPRRSVNFFDLLSEQARLVVKGMKLLNEYCITHDESIADEVIRTETEGDMVRRILIDELNRTFITPIDREDLFRFSSQLDEILDYAKTSVDEIRFFNVIPDDEMCSVTSALVDMCEHVFLAVKNIGKHKITARDEAIYVKRMENKVGDMTTRALAVLFDDDDHKRIFKYREIYRHLNQTADISDQAMDSLLDILVKM